MRIIYLTGAWVSTELSIFSSFINLTGAWVSIELSIFSSFINPKIAQFSLFHNRRHSFIEGE